jgi:Protein of unknown function (DUF3105)
VSRKLEEKQRRRVAEEQRRKEQRKEQRRRNLFTAGIIVVVATVVVALIVNERREQSGPVGVAQGEAGCGDIETFEPAGRTHVQDGTDVQYETSPPTSGDHYDQPAEAAFYSPESAAQIPEERFVHNLEHGQIVIWYSPSAPEEVRSDLEAYIDQQPGGQSLALLAVPYDEIEEPYSFTVAAWGASQSCEAVSDEVLDAFRERFQGRGPEQVGVPPFASS